MTPISQTVKFTHKHTFSSFVRTGQLAYLCSSGEGKPKIRQHEIQISKCLERLEKKLLTDKSHSWRVHV